MTKPLLCFLVLVPCVLASITLPATKLFQNTLKRWQINPTHDKDRLERWNRFVKMKKSVEETTSEVFLESLNKFTVLNDFEYDMIVKPLMENSLNFSEPLFTDEEVENHPVTRRHKRSKRDYGLPEELTFWEEGVTLSTPGDQASCGSCWSFPNVGTFEALNTRLSGEKMKFSEQYFVDCTFSYSGCAGGTVNEGYKITMMRQYLMSAEQWPYTADYQPCAFTMDIRNDRNNAMTKIWGQDYVPLGKNEESFLTKLHISPIAFGSYISDAIFGYSGGLYDDALCASQPLAHSMLMVGYTATYLRVKASYGPSFGLGGYINYKRGSFNMPSCRFFENGYIFTATYRREMQYDFCGDKKLVTRSVCLKSCEDKNVAGTETGWTLASIPTRYHNQKVVDLILAEYPGVKTDDKFNYFWMGLQDLTKTSALEWTDNFIPVNYANISNHDIFNWGKKYGTINKNSGFYAMKSSDTATHRGVCGRAVTCWDISSAVENGDVTFDREKLTEGTVATPKCDSGYTISDATTIACVGGLWNKDLPTCAKDGGDADPKCAAPTISDGTVSPSGSISTGSSYSVTCSGGFTIKGSATVTCTDNNGAAELSALPTCEQDAVEAKCAAPTIADGTVSPSGSISTGSSYSVTCSGGFTIKGSATVTCTDNNGAAELSALPTCEQDAVEAKCSAPTIADGTVSPSGSISTGSSYSVTCSGGFTIKGSATVTCTDNNGAAELSALPTCEQDAVESKCAAPTISDGAVSPSGSISTGSSYSVTCSGGFTIKGSATVTCTDNNGAAELSALPTCEQDAALVCSKPVVNGGAVTPADSEIDIGEFYTVTCNDHHTLNGVAKMTCSKDGSTAVLSSAPTCEEDTCNTAKAVITDGTIASGEKASYVFGDKIVYQCNSNFVMEGNDFIVCKGSKFSSAVPTCIAVNTNCNEFTVQNGKLSNKHPYFTNDRVKVTCDTDFILSGTNPRKCVAQSWARDAPTCTKDDGGQCKTLSAPRDGTISCTGDDNGKNVADTICTVGCDTSFQPVRGAVTETTCRDKSFLWTHQNKKNTKGTFPPCTEMIAPKAKKLKNQVTIGAVYCENESQKVLMGKAVESFLKDDLYIACLTDGKCEMDSVDCQYKSSKQNIQLTFTVKQTQDMLDKTILKEVKTKVTKSVKAETFTLSIDDSKRRKKRATTLSAEADSLETVDEVTCEDDEVVEDGVCVKCPAGYKTVDGACEACEIGTYNAAEGATECIACDGTKTTYGTGSTKADECYELCTVPEIAVGSLNQEAGFKVEPTYTLTLTCDETYTASVASFQCSSYSAETHKCIAQMQCKSADLAIENGVMSGATAPYEQGEKVSYKCNDGFKLVGNSELTCNNRAWSNAAPLCKTVNAKCLPYEVNHGKVDKSSGSFVTTESVSVECDYGYNLNGTNPRVCEDAGWKTDAQNCVYNEGTCPGLKAPVHGSTSCTGSNIKDTCTVSCNSGYIYLSEIKKVTCQEDLRWSHQSFTNSQGNFAACAKQETPKSRVLEAELYLDVDYCKTDPEKSAVVAAFETYIKSGSAAVPCLTGSKCTVQNTSCKNSDGSSVVSFELLQTEDLSSEDASTLTSSDSRLKELVSTEAMTFEVTTSKKRETTRFTAEDGSYTGNVKTACEAGFAQISGSCITCPAGHHIPGGDIPVCNACAVGTYSTAPNSVGCEKCTSGSTTYGKGSTTSGDCKKLCKVPGVTHGSMSPPTGYNVAPNTLIKMTCDIGFVLHTGEEKFECSTGIVPTCKEDGETDQVSDGGGSTTVIIVVVVVVLVVLAAGVIAAFFIRKRNLYSSDQNHAVRKTDNKAPVSGNNGFSENVYDTAETQNI
ncbi:sushi, von Willebrand factor type A, EGF and pentraxin domain-containing protein 1-like isoform X2 [Bolinopsis microptera]|uniref:sushi, von Willebrand factor type A, EGF and pentraxin domain-containing protein 1-like isoform X2 n=1 Tax=Bolinopsis microptera TaxID=2820187 RepID=UPI00307967E0